MRKIAALIIGLIVFITFVAVLSGFVFNIWNGDTNYGHHHTLPWYWHIGGMAVFWIVIVLLITGVTESITEKTDNKKAKDILDERYARGEIDEDTYKKQKKNLEDES